jgi:HEAT repeat protein
MILCCRIALILCAIHPQSLSFDDPSSQELQKRFTSLLVSLSKPDPETRAKAVEGLARTRMPSAAPAIIRCLQDPDEGVRQKAAQVLGWGGIPGNLAVPGLVKSLMDPKWEVRGTAALSLRDFAPELGDAPQELIGLLQDDSLEVRRIAADVIGEMIIPSNQTIIALTKALNDRSKYVRSAAANSLGKLASKNDTVAVTPLVELLKDNESIVRQQGAWALGQIGRRALPEGFAPLSKLLEDKDWVVRVRGAFAIWSIGSNSQVALTSLVGTLLNGNVEGRCRAAQALSQMGPQAKAAIPALLQTLKDDEPWEGSVVGGGYPCTPSYFAKEALKHIEPGAVKH